MLTMVCLHVNQKCTWLIISAIFSKPKDLSRAPAVMYTVNVVISVSVQARDILAQMSAWQGSEVRC